MSNFIYEHCGKAIIDSPHGHLTECEHYPSERAKRIIVEQKKIKQKVSLYDFRGSCPNISEGLSSEEFIRRMRDEWEHYDK